MGISADKVDKQAAFDAKHSLAIRCCPTPTVGGCGVRREAPGPIFNKRATFVIGTDRRILAAISSEANMNVHADQALATLRDAAH